MAVPAYGTNTEWKLTPNASLDAGTYNTRLVLTYGSGNVAYADVYLTVDKAVWDMSGITGAPAGAQLSYYYGQTPFAVSAVSTVDAHGETTYTFTSANGLQPSTTYAVGALASEDNNRYASAVTPLADGYTAYATPTFADVVAIDYPNERLTFVQGYNSGDCTLRCASCGGDTLVSPYSLSAILDDAANSSLRFSLVHNAGVTSPYPASEAGRAAGRRRRSHVEFDLL